MAIEHVYVWNNTSVIQDEVLAHRIGLVPLDAPPALFKYRNPTGVPTDQDTIVFKLNVTCEVDKNAPKEKGAPRKLIHEEVLSSDLLWVPQGEQETVFTAAGSPFPAPTNKVCSLCLPYSWLHSTSA